MALLQEPVNPKPKKKTKTQEFLFMMDQIKNMFKSRIHHPSKNPNHNHPPLSSSSSVSSNKPLISFPCTNICNVAHGNTRVVHRSDNSPKVGQETELLNRKHVSSSGSTRSSDCGRYTSSSSSRVMQFRKLSGCDECHTIVDPSRYQSAPKLYSCSLCGEVFSKSDNLELHQVIGHAVSELGLEDSSRNIIEMIFNSSWFKKDTPICKIERILKIHNTQRTIQRFENCRDSVKIRAVLSPKRNPRCAADGNELLRFHCTTIACALGSGGSSNLCGLVPKCGICTIIRHGFKTDIRDRYKGVCTASSSVRAHDSLTCPNTRRAMVVCRVIAGRVLSAVEEDVPQTAGLYDSISGYGGAYSNFEEIFVSNSRAILPCFVVVYKVI